MAEHCNADCHIQAFMLSVVMVNVITLSVVMLNVVMLNDITLSVIMLNVAAQG